MIRLAVSGRFLFCCLRFKTRAGRMTRPCHYEFILFPSAKQNKKNTHTPKTPHAHSLLSTYKCCLLKDYKKQTQLLKMNTLSITDLTSNPYITVHGVDIQPPLLQSRSPSLLLFLFLFLSFHANTGCHIMASHSRESTHISSQSCYVTSPYQLIT